MKEFEVPKELADKALQVIQDARVGGKIRKGTNETTKSIEKSEAQLVIIAKDTNPAEIVAHIPLLCEEKKIPCIWVPTKQELGTAAGLPVGTSAISVVDAGEGKKKLVEIAKSLAVLSGAESAPKAEKPAEKPAEAKPAKQEAPAEKPAKPKAPKKPKAEAAPAESK